MAPTPPILDDDDESLATFLRASTATADIDAANLHVEMVSDEWLASDHAHATSAVRLGGSQPFSTLEAPLSAKSVLAFLLKRAGLPKEQMARRLRVSEIGVTSLLIRVNHARRDPLVAAWLDGIAASMPNFHDLEEVA